MLHGVGMAEGGSFACWAPLLPKEEERYFYKPRPDTTTGATGLVLINEVTHAGHD